MRSYYPAWFLFARIATFNTSCGSIATKTENSS